MLQALGLSPAEEAVYTALLARPTGSAQDLARQTGLDRCETDRILLDLAARGLVATAPEAGNGAPGSADRYRLTPPSVALAPLLVEQRSALQRAEAAFSMLTEQYRSTAAHPAGSVVEVVVGVEQVAHRFHQLQLGAQRELLSFLVGEPTAVPREDTDMSESSALDRGVDFRIVATKDYLDDPDVTRDVRAGITAGIELRVAETLPLKMLVSDRERAMVPLDLADSGGEPSAIVVHRSGLLAALVQLFEKEWAPGAAVVHHHLGGTRGGDGRSAADREGTGSPRPAAGGDLRPAGGLPTRPLDTHRGAADPPTDGPCRSGFTPAARVARRACGLALTFSRAARGPPGFRPS